MVQILIQNISLSEEMLFSKANFQLDYYLSVFNVCLFMFLINYVSAFVNIKQINKRHTTFIYDYTTIDNTLGRFILEFTPPCVRVCVCVCVCWGV